MDEPGGPLIIARLGHRGDGIADSATGPVHVAYALPGETVRTRSLGGHPERHELVAIDAPSPDRIAPICPHFGVCGGCAVQHAAEPLYRVWKRESLVVALQQAGINAEVGDLVDAHGAGRRRVTLHARDGADGRPAVGFAAPRAHHIVPITVCPILAPALDGALPAARALAAALQPLRKPLDIQITATANGLDVDIRGSGPLDARRTADLATLAQAHRLARLTRHGESVIQRQPPTIPMGRAALTLPPGSFLQATEAGEAALADLVLAATQGSKTIADLFCGVGPFALRLAERARVIAADSHEPAVEALRRAASATSGLKPVDAQTRDLFRRPFVAAELKRVDAVVFDPPRQGAEAQARELAQSKVPTVVAVSCSAATFARDAGILIDGGYRLAGAITPIDQFRYSAHVEIAAVFRR